MKILYRFKVYGGGGSLSPSSPWTIMLATFFPMHFDPYVYASLVFSCFSLCRKKCCFFLFLLGVDDYFLWVNIIHPKKIVINTKKKNFPFSLWALKA